MAISALIFFGVLFLSWSRGLRAEDILCEDGFCRTYSFEVGCTAAAQECRINNATHSGLFLPSPTLCNCCDFCLPFYGENEFCSLGGTGDGTSVGRCGDGLTCVSREDGNYCERMDSTSSSCHAQQDAYDQRYELGEIGALEMRPSCDGKGNFAAFDCVPTQTCFCQSEDGSRLFGEVLYQGSTSTQNMICGCSRMHQKIQESISAGLRYPSVGPRCTSDGNFNPVQCIQRICHCVDRLTGEVQGDHRVNLDEKSITELPCYDPTLDLFPQLSGTEPPYNYTSPCFEAMEQKIQFIKESEEEGFIVEYFSTVSECLPDGTYGRVSLNRNGSKICVDEWSQQIGDYEAEPNTPEFENMDCKCAVTSLLMSSSVEQPVCCKNGNFRPIQCRRGECRCVDYDGRQVAREAVDVTTLPCYTDDWRTC